MKVGLPQPALRGSGVRIRPPMSGRSQRIIVVGGGLGGALLATLLGRSGYNVELHERRPDPRNAGASRGRSINLAVSVRGLHGLAQVGLEGRVLQQAIPMRGRMIHTPSGQTVFQPYDKDPGRYINSVSRAALNEILLDAARAEPNIRVHFDSRCLEVDSERGAARMVDTNSGAERTVEGDILVGVDGAYSAVRSSLQKTERFNYSQSYLAHGYKELTIPPGPGGTFQLERNALHIWPRKAFMMIALPNPDGSFTCTLFLPYAGEPGFNGLESEAQIREFFDRWFPDAAALMPTLIDDFQRNPVGSMVTIRCQPWWLGRAVLAGDAAHAVVPFYGQGMNAAFESCLALHECLLAHPDDPQRAFRDYESRRKRHVDALADLALANFIEMRDKTGSRAFRTYKRIERTLHRLFPGWYTPLYTLVSFTRTPYDDARQQARRQDQTALAVATCVLLALAVGAWMLFT